MVHLDLQELMGSMVTVVHLVLKEKKESLAIKENLVRVDLQVLKVPKVTLGLLASLDLLGSRVLVALKENLENLENMGEKETVGFKGTPDYLVNLGFKGLQEKREALELQVNREILVHLELRETLAPSVHQDYRELQEIKVDLDLKDQLA